MVELGGFKETRIEEIIMNVPQVSVIVPVYKVEKYLHRCVDSILNQTFTDFELILVDDGSPDNCGAICDEYAAKDSRIVVIHQENRGQAAARNRALDVARGEWIAFVDSDDWVHPRFLEILLGNALKNQAKISICGHVKVFGDSPFGALPADEQTRCWNGEEYVRKCFLGEVPHKAWLLWDKLFHRDCFAICRLPEGRIYEDNATVYKLLYEADCIVECDEVLYFYYQNEGSTVNQAFRHKHLDKLLVPEEMICYFSEKKDDRMVDEANRMYLSVLVALHWNVKQHLDDPKVEKELKGKLRNQYHRERKKYSVTIQTHPGLYEILFPGYAWCYWTGKGICNKLRRR